MERVRPAERGDLARCAELLSQALEATAGQRGGAQLVGDGAALLVGDRSATGRAPADELVGAWAIDEDRLLLVGLFEEAVVGIAAGHRLADPTRAARIECCYVEPSARQVGVGTALVAGLLEWFHASGCQEVDAVALPGDRSAKQLLESAGFKARLLVLHRSLG